MILLAARPRIAWTTSCTNTIFGGMRQMVEDGNDWMAAMLRLLAERFDDRVEDHDAMVAAFERHNDQVRAGVPKERLLEWTAADGWDPICDRLGVPVPDAPFPNVNTTAEFREMLGLPAPRRYRATDPCATPGNA